MLGKIRKKALFFRFSCPYGLANAFSGLEEPVALVCDGNVIPW